MKFKKASATLSFIIIASMTSSIAFADDAGWYLGGNIGQTRADIDEQRIAESLLQNGFSNTLVKDDSIDSGYKLFGGYQFNRYLALEGGYFNLGEFSFTSTTQPAGTFNGSLEVHGFNLDVVGTIPISEKFSAFARAGITYAQTKDVFNGTGSVNVLSPTAKERDTNLKVGAGLQYAFNDNWSMRLEAERYRINDAVGHTGDIDLLSVGLVYRFGAKPAAVIAPAPAQAPVTAPMPRFEKLSISATELFAFDSAEVSQAQPELEKLTTTLQSTAEPKRVNIVGYTDRLGSDNYNQKLSEQRALAVKNYMVAKGIAAERLATEGKGEQDPVVQCDEKNREKLIECLQPNRRVQIDKIEVEREIAP